MEEPEWVELDAVLALHRRGIALHGGLDGIRDHGLLESALHRPKNRRHYEDVDLLDLAATYAAAISGNHPFLDGNKRAAFLCMTLFLRLNGYRLLASQADAARTMLALAAGQIGIVELTAWLRANVATTPPPSAA